MTEPRAGAQLLIAIALAGCQIATPTASPGQLNVPTPTGPTATGPASTSQPSGTLDSTASPSTAPADSSPPLLTGPTSAQLIIDAVEAGTLDETTALLYRVYGAFGDSRLPAGYDSGRVTEDGAALAMAQEQIDTLPEELAAQIRPFLVRPTDPDSVFAGEVAATANRRGIRSKAYAGSFFQLGNPYTAANFVCEQNGWGHIDGGAAALGGPAWKIWTICGDQAALDEAVQAAGDMDKFWAAETALMGVPIRDSGGRLEAGDGPIDVYLANGAQCSSTGGRCLSAAGPRHMEIAGYSLPAPGCVRSGNANKCSGYIVLLRPYGADAPSTLAHELFHVLQNAYNAYGTLNGGGRWNWFVEASAKWAQWRYYPPSRPGRVYDYFTNFLHTQPGLTTVDGTNEYSSLVWPLFLQLKAGGEQAIKRAWAQIEGKAGNADVDAAINSVLPFASSFKDFAATGWNEPLSPGEPVAPHFRDLDGGFSAQPPGGVKYTDIDLPANPKGTPPREVPVSMPPLSVRYTELFPDEKVKQITLDFSSVAPPGYFDVVSLLKIKDPGWQRRDLPAGVTRFCRDKPDENVQQLIIALADHEFDPTHDLRGHWTVESLADPCADWNITIDWTDVYDHVEDKMHFVGVADTVDDTMSTDEMTYLTGVGTVSGTRAGWKGCNPGIDVTPAGTVSATFFAIVDAAAGTVTVSAYADVDTALSGITTDLFTATLDDAYASGGANVKIDPRQPFGDLCPHYSFGSATIQGIAPPSP